MNFHMSRPVRIAIALVMATCVQQLIAMPDPDTGFKGWRLSGVVKNFFGRQPPTDVYSSSYYSVGYNASLFDVRGRYFSLSANYEF